MLKTAYLLDGKPAAAEDFKLQINDPGRHRLRLTYLPGQIDAKCPLASRHTKIVNSKPFDVAAAE